MGGASLLTLRSLSPDSDVLAVGSIAAAGTLALVVAELETEGFGSRRGIPQQVSLSSAWTGLRKRRPQMGWTRGKGHSYARGLVASYGQGPT